MIVNEDNINKFIKDYEKKSFKNILINPLFRIKLTHIIAVIVLMISAIFFTNSLISISIQVIIAIIIILHDFDDKNLKVILSNKIQSLNDKEKKLNTYINKMDDTLSLINTHIIYSKTDLNGIITDVSDAFSKISGYSKEELIGKRYELLTCEDNDKKIFTDLWKTIKEDKIWTGEIKNLNKHKDYYWIESMISPDFDENNIKIGYVSINHDITAKKNFELQSIQLLESEKLASLGDMIANIAHQWRQPLNAISTTASGMCVNYEYNIEQKEEKIVTNLNKIITYTENLSDTIDVFRNFLSKDKNYEMYSLEESVNDALSIVNAVLKQNNIKLKNNIYYSDNDKIIMVKGELSQVIINILNNSKDALLSRNISDGLIKIDLTRKNNKIIISIEDNAGGINKDVFSKIFEPYFTTKHKSNGIGLGLHMSYQIIKKSFNGHLYAKNINNGVKFFIELPIEKRLEDRRKISLGVHKEQRIRQRRI